jgi:carboxymethylenebutenolidase
LKAVFVFYGFPPPTNGMKNIQCPIYGFYGGNDARVTLTVAPGLAAMKQAGKIFEPVVYDGAGHGFMAHGDPGFPEAPAANRKARDEAWVRWKELLQKI